MSILISACSAPDSSQGVVSTEDLSTVTTVTTIVENICKATQGAKGEFKEELLVCLAQSLNLVEK